jgi:hypothetical protein
VTDDQARTQYEFVVKNAMNYRGVLIKGTDTGNWVCTFTTDAGRHVYIPYACWMKWHREGLT